MAAFFPARLSYCIIEKQPPGTGGHFSPPPLNRKEMRSASGESAPRKIRRIVLAAMIR